MFIRTMKIKISLGIFLIFSLGLHSSCSSRESGSQAKGENIICFGNSITQGAGATQGNDYPSLLAKKINRTVINAGVNGNTTDDALSRIETDVLERDPRLVIIEFSGNDFLQGIPNQRTFSNLDKLVALIQEKHAFVVLVEVAAGHFGDEYLSGFKKIAKKRRVLLIPNILEGIMTNPTLKSDEIHPNDEGYRLIAERIYKQIKPFLK